MGFSEPEPTKPFHVLAMPYPGRGHINPVMNFSKILASKHPHYLITFVVTEEWFGFIGADALPHNIRFATIPNCVPSELVRARDIVSFIEATQTQMAAPFGQLLDRLEQLPNVILHDTYLTWVVGLGNRRNIPVASFYTMSATVFSVLQRFRLLEEEGHFPVDLSASGEDRVDYIPGMSSTRLMDIGHFVDKNTSKHTLNRLRESFSQLPNTQCVLLPTIYELESSVIDALRKDFSYPILTIGPAVPYFNLKHDSANKNLDYFQWLEKQPKSSVLYVSMGSFLSVSSTQMEEIAAGLRKSGVQFLWVAREESSRMREICGDNGFIVSWCDQLSVLSHSSVGGFWSHCGWSSTMEGVFSGLPFLTFPLVVDQLTNSKMIVEDWKIGWRVKEDVREGDVVSREEIATLVRKFMNLECGEVKEIRRRARELQKVCQAAVANDGSSENGINAFVRHVAGHR